MNIAFDAVAILSPTSKNRGIGNYSLAQFREMISRDKENTYFFFNVFEPFSLGDYPNLKEECFDCGKDRSVLFVSEGAVFKSLVQNFIKKNKIDVFYITSPFDDHIPVYKKDWFEEVQTVATVYDIIPYVFKEHYLCQNESYFAWYMSCVDMLRWVDKLLVISQSVKDDLISYLDFKPDNIEVIWGASSSMFRPVDVPKSAADALKKKYRIKNKFIMCTGGDDARKNIAGLVEGYAKLPEALKEQYSLVVVCKLQAVSEERYRNLAAELGVQGKVILTNFVSDEDLILFYNMASLVAFPSKYEGFGLPVVEAWACNTPVLTSNNSSLVQIAGDAATIVDADNTDDIARGLKEALQEENLKIMAERGVKRLELFRWPAVADKTIAEIHSMKTAPEARGKARMAWFSPLPPQQSGIADYSVDVLNALAGRFEIDVFIDDGYSPDCDLDSSIKVYNHREFTRQIRKYDYLLYQMGNSLFHYYMFPYLRSYGGTLVLHDYNMHGVGQAIALHICNDGLKTYQEYLLEDYPKEFVDRYLNEVRMGGPVDTSYELNGFVSNYADKIIVHSDYAKERLLKRDIGRRVITIPHYAKVKPLCDTAEVKKRFGYPADSFIIGAFGQIHHTKRAIPLLKAAIRFIRKQPNAYMVFVGKLEECLKPEFQKTLKNCGVEERIKVTGYVDLDQFRDYIDATDVCFNLRYPYNGENSGSLARILSRKKCVVVNDIGSFGEIPNPCCVKLPSAEKQSSKREEKLIYQTMKKLYENADLREKIGENARKYAEETLDLEIVADQYTGFIKEPRRACITEDILNIIREQEILGKGYTKTEANALAKTLAYCVE